MWRTLQDRVLLVIVALLVMFIGLLALLPSFHKADRRVAICWGRTALADAYRGYTNTGSLTGGDSIWLSTNTVTIANTQYQCLIQLRSPMLSELGEGSLAMTSDHTFVWLGSNCPAKLITPDY
jgi:hypothetical protein